MHQTSNGWGLSIHEAAHIWQKNTNRHRGGTGGVDYDYNASQLASLNLKREEHARAVQDWFIATYYNLRPDLDRSPESILGGILLRGVSALLYSQVVKYD